MNRILLHGGCTSCKEIIFGRYARSQFNLFPDIDIVGVKLSLSHHSMFVLALYIPPNINAATYETLFDMITANIHFLNEDKLIILGDFNIPSYVNYLGTSEISNRYIGSLINFCEFLGLDQYNKVLNSNGRLLDLVLSRSQVMVNRLESYLVPEDPRHPPLDLYFSLQSDHNRHSGNNKPSFNFKKADFNKLYDDLCNIDWSYLSSFSHVNGACTQLYDKLNSVFLQSVPKTTPKNTSYPPWFTGAIVKDIKQKSRLWNLYKGNNEVHYFNQFKALRSKIKRTLNLLKKIHSKHKNKH